MVTLSGKSVLTRQLKVSTTVGELGFSLADDRLDRVMLPLAGCPVMADWLPAPVALEGAVQAWFTGEEGALRAWPRRLVGTPFQERIWRVVMTIPRGEMWTYGEVARSAGFGPGHARAVGGAMRANPLPLIVPCHRVVGTCGSLVGFSGSEQAGLDLKRRLLALEGIRCEE